MHAKAPKENCLAIVSDPVSTWRERLTNDFEESVFALYPEIKAVRDLLYHHGALYAQMSGSGSAVFGLFAEAPAGIGEQFEGMFCEAVQLP